MKKLFLLLVIVFAAADLNAKVWLGPHFNYTRLRFNNPSELRGYGAGITAGAEFSHCCYFSNIEFEGTWNAGPITGCDCQRSSFNDYLVDWRAGYTFWWNDFIIKPYLGFGWNRFDNTQDPQTAALRYQYNKLFVPVGFYAYYVPYYGLFETISAGIQLEFRPDVYAKLEVVSVNLEIKHNFAFRLQVPLEYTYCDRYSFALVPFYNWNKFGRCKERSCVGIPLDIPTLTHWSAGVRALFGIQF